jgi:hypothetical protein
MRGTRKRGRWLCKNLRACRAEPSAGIGRNYNYLSQVEVIIHTTNDRIMNIYG